MIERQNWRPIPEDQIENYIIREFKADNVLLSREILRLRRQIIGGNDDIY